MKMVSIKTPTTPVVVDCQDDTKPNTVLKVPTPDLEFLIANGAGPQPATIQRALSLYNSLKDSISWNGKLEVIIRNQVLQGTNIVNLIIYAVTNYNNNKNRGPTPRGWSTFIGFLRQLNLNPEIFSTKTQNIINKNSYSVDNQKWEVYS